MYREFEREEKRQKHALTLPSSPHSIRTLLFSDGERLFDERGRGRGEKRFGISNLHVMLYPDDNGLDLSYNIFDANKFIGLKQYYSCCRSIVNCVMLL